jgi:DNA-binding MarR family transcriptional regulator
MAEKILRIKILIIAIIIISFIFVMANYSAENGNDADGDELPDSWELENFGNISTYSSEDDPDDDDLNNSAEYHAGTDPNNKDSDADNMPDGWEVQYKLEPNDYHDAHEDLDGDGFSNYEEFRYSTHPDNKTDSPKKPAKDDGMDADEMDSSAFCIVIFAVPAVVILIAILFVYTKMRREQLLEHKVRAQIFEYVNKNPGTHYRGIMNQLNLHMGVLTHHLNMLEQEQYIKSFQDGMYRRFYPKDAVIQPKLILNEVQHRILKLISNIPGVSQVSLAKNLKVTTKVVNYHVKILANAGFIHVQQVGRETQLYYLDGLDIDAPPGPDSEGVSSPKAAA